MSGPSPESDITTLLTHDHEVLKHLSTGFKGLSPDDMDKRFRDLVFNLVRHEVAEERIVYPAVRSGVLPGDAVGSALMEEENEIEQLLAVLEHMDVDAGSFAEVLDGLQSKVLEHMRDEELNLFPLLRDLVSDMRRWELGDHYMRAVRSATTHPHPRIPNNRAGTMALEPIAAIVDRVRDAIRSSAR